MDLDGLSIFGQQTTYVGIVNRLIRIVDRATLLDPEFYVTVVAAAMQCGDYGQLGVILLTADQVALNDRPAGIDQAPLPDGMSPSQLEVMVATAVVAGCRARLEQHPAYPEHDEHLTSAGFLYVGQTAVTGNGGIVAADLYGHRQTTNVVVVSPTGIEEYPVGHPHLPPAAQLASDRRDWILARSAAAIRRAGGHS